MLVYQRVNTITHRNQHKPQGSIQYVNVFWTEGEIRWLNMI